jgi:hypothetical protein
MKIRVITKESVFATDNIHYLGIPRIGTQRLEGLLG